MSLDVEDKNHAGDLKLPLWKTIRRSYATYFSGFPDVLRASWLWIILVAVLIGGGCWLQLSWTLGAIAEFKMTGARSAPAMPLWIVLPPAAGYLVMMLAAASIPVAWHRRVILGEHPGFCGANVATKNLWRFVGVYLVIGLAGVFPAYIVTAAVVWGIRHFGSGLPGAVYVGLVIFVVLVWVTAFWIMLRLIMLLPARAIGDNTLTFRKSWKRTRGNAWRLFWGSIACTLVPVMPLYIALIIGTVGFGAAGGFSEAAFIRLVIVTTLSTVYLLLILPIFVGFLSHAYQHFFGATQSDGPSSPVPAG